MGRSTNKTRVSGTGMGVQWAPMAVTRRKSENAVHKRAPFALIIRFLLGALHPGSFNYRGQRSRGVPLANRIVLCVLSMWRVKKLGEETF